MKKDREVWGGSVKMRKKKCAAAVMALVMLTGCQEAIHVGMNLDQKDIQLQRKEVHTLLSNNSTTQVQVKPWNPIPATPLPSSKKVSYSFSNSNKTFTKPFPEHYQSVEGILTFRGNGMRDTASMGKTTIKQNKLVRQWEMKTSLSKNWGGGAGWTGQASVIQWNDREKNIMNLFPAFKKKAGLKEIVYASLDGKVYFLDSDTGKQTRNPISISNPIKGSVALDPRGYPLLYVGQGIPEVGKIGYRIYSLIDGKLLAFIPGIDSFAFRKWGAFDSAPIINRDDDSMLLAGENGLVYFIKLQTKYNPAAKKITVSPIISKYRYKQQKNQYQGIENSIAVYKNLAYFSDNNGGIQALDIISKKLVWANDPYDDTDATLVVESVQESPYIYTGSEIDKQGTKGSARIQKLNGLNGKVVWEHKIPGFSLKGEKPVNGGVLGTPILGKGPLAGQVIFNISRYKTFNGGLLISFDTKTGKEKWRLPLTNYAWSSTVPIYTTDNKAYLIQGDSVGNLFLINGQGKIVSKINLGANIEASPIVVNQQVIVATRGGKIISVKIH